MKPGGTGLEQEAAHGPGCAEVDHHRRARTGQRDGSTPGCGSLRNEPTVGDDCRLAAAADDGNGRSQRDVGGGPRGLVLLRPAGGKGEGRDECQKERPTAVEHGS